MKECRSCKQVLPYTDFCIKAHNKDGYSYYCRGCTAIKAKKYYDTVPGIKSKVLKRNNKSRLEKKIFVYNYLIAHPCACGEARPECLDFDHQKDKVMNISQMIRRNSGLDTIKKEIEKCIVRCANCHRAVTAKQFGWYNGLPDRTRTCI
jgi:hypothetical protein